VLLVVYNEALAAAQALPLIEQRLRKILRHEEKAPRHNVCRVTQRVPDAVRASEAHQSEHTQLAQCGSDEECATLLHTDVDAVLVPLLRVSSRQIATAKKDLQALRANSRRSAEKGMRRELGNERTVMASHRNIRVRFEALDERMQQNAR
jgi:hypothetical protein